MRGRHYSSTRCKVEAVLRRLYARDWPARAWGHVPGAARVSPVSVRLARDRPGRPPLRLAFLSDLHLGPTTAPATLERAVALANQHRPDLVLLGGDYVFLEATADRCRAIRDLLSQLQAPLKLGVWGNHDLWTDHAALEQALQAAGVTMLVNQQHRLPPPHDDVVVLGLDEPWTGAPDGTPLHSDAAVRIGLAHGPDGYDHLARAAPDLLLCGHTHGGQVCLPGGRPLTVPGQRSRQWPHGVHEHQGTCIVVSRGIGGVEIPVRLFAPPDVVWVTVG